jgi:protease-4
MAKKSQSAFLKDITRSVGQVAVDLVNAQRARQLAEPLRVVQFNLPAAMPALPDTRNLIEQRLFGRSPMSVAEFETALRRLMKHAGHEAIIVVMNNLAMALADLQSLRDALLRYRAAGHRVYAYAQGYDMASYLLATAADEIWLQPGAPVVTTGLVQQQVFLKNALDTVGLEADVVAISPYKSAADALSLAEPSAESRAQVEWLLDSEYEVMLSTMANGRGKTLESVRAMINTAPHTDAQALELGYVDHICNEEGFAARAGSAPVMWEDADARLPLDVRFDQDYVAIVPLTGMIVNGSSARPPVDIPVPLVGGERMGDATVVQAIRQLMEDDNARAVVLFIDSPGGSATASEAIASALDELARTRPVVAVMGSVAASGGYYISTPADWVVAQPLTITGSIGVVMAKLITNEMLKKLRFNPFYYLRGDNAAMFTPISRFTQDERDKLREAITRIYDVFLQRVADARKKKVEEIDAIGGGRVWTGAQALEHGLIDQLGGLYEGLAKARELAGLHAEAPARLFRVKGSKPLPAQVAEKVDPAAAVNYWYAGVTALANGQALYLTPYEL